MELLHNTQSHDNPGKVEHVAVMLTVTGTEWGLVTPKCVINTVSCKIQTQACSMGCVDSLELRVGKRGQQ